MLRAAEIETRTRAWISTRASRATRNHDKLGERCVAKMKRGADGMLRRLLRGGEGDRAASRRTRVAGPARTTSTGNSAKRENIRIEGDDAIWSNTWISRRDRSPGTWSTTMCSSSAASPAPGQRSPDGYRRGAKHSVATLPVYLNTGRSRRLPRYGERLSGRQARWRMDGAAARGSMVSAWTASTSTSRTALRAGPPTWRTSFGRTTNTASTTCATTWRTRRTALVQHRHHFAIVDGGRRTDRRRAHALIISGPTPEREMPVRRVQAARGTPVQRARQLITGLIAEAKEALKAWSRTV